MINKTESGLYLCFFPGVSKRMCKFLTRAGEMLTYLVEIKHPVEVNVVPHPSIIAGNKVGFGMFDHQELTIYVGAGMADLPNCNRNDVLETLCHEAVHYEQYRDRRPIQERGVSVRARNLTTKILSIMQDKAQLMN
jgi:hypothetical protein